MKLVALFLCGLAGVASAQEAFSVDGKSSTIRYRIVHKLHEVEGVSRKVTGRALLAPDGKLQVAVRVPSDSFDSGNVNRDAHQKEAMESAQYPVVELKALAEGLSAPATFPKKQQLKVKAQLSLHGVQQLLDVPVEITWESPRRALVAAHFAVSLDGFHIERPSLMFVKVDDQLQLDARVVFER